jgi:excisionase family DNA binding protein
MAEGRTGGHSYTPAEAALILRVTPTRVRQLLQDGELQGERDEAGHWLIPARAVHERAERLRRESFLEAVGYDLSSMHETRELIEELRDRIQSLEGQLSEERQANRENRCIIAALTQRIPELPSPQETPSEPPGGSEAVPEMPMGPEPQEAREEAQEPAQPRSSTPWWRRMFGG